MPIALWSGGGNTSTKAPSSSAGRISVWGGSNVPNNPTPAALAVSRQKQAQADKQAKQQKQQQDKQVAQQKSNNSLLGRAKAAGAGIVKDAANTIDKSINTVGAGVSGTVGLATAGVQTAKGDKAGAKRTLTATQQDMDERLKKSYLTPEEAHKGGTALIKPGAQAVADIAPYVIPVGKTAKGASLLAKTARGAVDNAAVSGATTLANEAIQGRIRDKKTAGETAKSLLAGAVVGAAGPLLHGAVKEGAAAVSTKDAKAALITAKQGTLLSKAKAANSRDTIANTAINRVSALQTNAADKLGKAATTEAKTTHVPVVSPAQTKAGTGLLGKISVNEAKTQRIPVQGKEGTTSVGKAKTIDDATYVKQTNKLSKAYDAESKAAKASGPINQQAKQDAIDSKYQALQAQLDESAGKTTVKFGSSNPQPRAVLDHNTGNALDTVMANVHQPKAVFDAQAADNAAATAADKSAQETTKATEKATADTQKIDKQLELLDAKKKDAEDGRLSNVDQVKIKQLKEQKAELNKITGNVPVLKAFGREIPMTKENGYTAVETTSGTVYKKINRTGRNNKDSSLNTNFYDANGKKISNDQANAAINSRTTAPVAEAPIAQPEQLPSAEAPQPVAAPEVPVAKPAGESLPDTTAERGTSKIAASVQQKAVERGLKDTFGEAGGYDKITIADQAEKAVALTKDPERLNRVINGEEKLPDGLRATALITAVEKDPVLSKDHDLINRLSKAEHLTGESSRSAQELRLAAERYEHSPVEAVKQVREARMAAVEKKTGKTVAKATIEEVKAIKAEKPKVTKQTWESFVDGLKC